MLHHQLGEEQWRVGNSRGQGSEQCSRAVLEPVSREELPSGGQCWWGASHSPQRRNGRRPKPAWNELSMSSPSPAGWLGCREQALHWAVFWYTETWAAAPHNAGVVVWWSKKPEKNIQCSCCVKQELASLMNGSRCVSADVQPPPAPRGVGVHWSHMLWPGHGCSLVRTTFSGFLLTIFEGWRPFVALESVRSN